MAATTVAGEYRRKATEGNVIVTAADAHHEIASLSRANGKSEKGINLLPLTGGGATADTSAILILHHPRPLSHGLRPVSEGHAARLS